MLPYGVILESNRSATPECSRTGMWARFTHWLREWRDAPLGRCGIHGCPTMSRSGYGGYLYESMDIEFCPICEDEEYMEKQARWMPIKSKKRSDDSPMTPSLVTA